jgi:hypothetical protein
MVRGGQWRRIISHFSFGEVRETNLRDSGNLYGGSNQRQAKTATHIKKMKP